MPRKPSPTLIERHELAARAARAAADLLGISESPDQFKRARSAEGRAETLSERAMEAKPWGSLSDNSEDADEVDVETAFIRGCWEQVAEMRLACIRARGVVRHDCLVFEQASLREVANCHDRAIEALKTAAQQGVKQPVEKEEVTR